MKQTTIQHLKILEAKHSKRKPTEQPRLKVFYGFSKINKIQKREAIQVVYENEQNAGSNSRRSGKTLRKIMNVVTERWQTEKESADAAYSNRVFTSYCIFLDDKKINGSLMRALQANSDADKNNISDRERKEIMKKLREAFLTSHVNYKEPNIPVQLELKF